MPDADFTAFIDGAATLEGIQQRCIVEQDGGVQLQAIKFGTITAEGRAIQVNIAEFMIKPTGRLKNLLFVDVTGKAPAAVKQDREAEGWTTITKEPTQILVQNQVKSVMVFGKRKFDA